MRPVPKVRSSEIVQPSADQANASRPTGWSLQWRKSSLIEDRQNQSISRQAYNAEQPMSGSTGRTSRPANRQPVRQVAFQSDGGFAMPENIAEEIPLQADGSPTRPQPPSVDELPSPSQPAQSGNSLRDGNSSRSQPPADDLNSLFEDYSMPSRPNQRSIPQTPGGDSIESLLEQAEPLPDTPSPATGKPEVAGENGDPQIESPSDQPFFDGPFDRSQAGGDQPRSPTPPLPPREQPRPGTPANPFDRSDDGLRLFGDDDRPSTRELGLTCEEFRDRIAADTIDRVSLDISPPFRPDEIDEERYREFKSEFDEQAETRVWRSIEGRPLGTGRLDDLAYEKAIIVTEYGGREEIPLDRLSEADLAYISQSWGLPIECRLEQVEFTPRQWEPTTVVWAASNLCHKPLYFEEVNLERYGHTAGPLAQPVISSAHFFLNIAVLPYKMGVHGPHECQYALGYYRPGNCAPWIIPPVPLSVRGAWYQAAAVTGTALLVP